MENNGLQDARLLIGTVTGNIFALYVATLELSELVLYEDSIAQSLSLKDDARPADEIIINPKDGTKILLVFNSLTIAYYDLGEGKVLKHWDVEQPILSISWCVEEDHFICSHKDGSIDVWSLDKDHPVEPPTIPFGPFPCTPVTKVLCGKVISHNSVVKFYSGGMPRASYGDRFTVSAQRPERLVVFDFGSPVIDFILYSSTNAGDGKVTALLVLCEQELVCIDLTDSSWPVLDLPYLNSVHSSQVTCLIHSGDIEDHTWKKLISISELKKDRTSGNRWPITAGINLKGPEICASSNVEQRQLLISGHENGMVKFWSIGSPSMRHILTIDTAKEFEGYIPRDEERPNKRKSSTASNNTDSSDESDESTEWPPFRKVGVYDPFCDDPRLAVQKLFFSASTGHLVVGGRAGHAIVYSLEDELIIAACVESIDFEIIENPKTIHSIPQRPLPPRKCLLPYGRGYQPVKRDPSHCFIVQLIPSTPVTAISYLKTRSLLAVGCEYGFVLCDMKAQTALVRKSFTTGAEVENITTNTALSRFRSMKKSIRQSFRRKKKTPQANNTSHETAPECSSTGDNACEVKPVERQVAARTENQFNAGDPLPFAVRAFSFFNAYVVSTSSKSDSLWVGTNEGVILLYGIADDALKPEDACVLLKELHLQHRGPVIDFECCSTDASAFGKVISNTPRIIVYTEEQIKTFSLPALKPMKFKYKLTSLEGSRLRKAYPLTLKRNSDKRLSEKFVAVITNQGELSLFTAFSLRKCAKARFTKVTDVVGIASAIVSKHGELFYLRPGGSEIQRASLTPIPHTNLISPFKGHKFPPA
uniref:LLGL domain-containing protein n=1 Tax=Syphacia muris TaxID=451379 RepID=A0A0N5APA8_9BILA